MIMGSTNPEFRLRELPEYPDNSFPVSMHTITRYSIDRKGRGYKDAHWHDEMQFTLATVGSLSILVNGERHTLQQGEVIFVNKGVVHMVDQMEPQGEYVGFMFPEKLLGFYVGSRMEQDYVLPLVGSSSMPAVHLTSSVPWQRKAIDHVYEAKETFDKLNRLYAAAEDSPLSGEEIMRNEGYEYYISLQLANVWYAMISNLKSEISEISREMEGKHKRFKKMIAFIDDHYSEDIRLVDIAGSASVCEEECRRCFKQITGMVPSRYLNEFRVSKSMSTLLTERDMSVTEVASMNGFNNTSYFINCFKKYTGMTPKEYRNKAGKTGY